MKERFVLMSFATTHHAIGMEIALEQASIAARLIPTPTEISAGCGLVLRFGFGDLESVKGIAAEKAIEYDGLYDMSKDGRNKIITPLE